MKTKTDPEKHEQKLLSRLKMMGGILLFCSLCTLVWEFIPSVEDEIDALLLEIEETPAPLNPYLVSSSFAIVGTCCLFIYWHKRKNHSS